MAAAIAKHQFPQHKFVAAGLYKASRIDPRAGSILREMRMKPRRLVRKALDDLDLAGFDLVIALDGDAHQLLKTKPIKRLLRWRIPDPYIDQLQMYRTIARSLVKRMVGLEKKLA